MIRVQSPVLANKQGSGEFTSFRIELRLQLFKLGEIVSEEEIISVTPPHVVVETADLEITSDAAK